MVVKRDESRLVARAVQGDAEAFGDLYELHLDAIYRYVYYRLSNHQDTEDLTERVFLKAWENMPGYRVGKTPFRAWLYRIAHNTVIDHYRAQQEALPLSEDLSIVDTSIDLEQQLLLKERSERLAKVISRLSPDHQHVLILRFIEGLSTKEVAQILNRSVGGVRVLQHRALKEMYGLWAVEEVASD